MVSHSGRFGDQDPSLRDRALGALVWLHLAEQDVPLPDLSRAILDAEDFLWAAASGNALYGLPEWIAKPELVLPAEASELNDSLREILLAVTARQDAAKAVRNGDSNKALGETELRELVSATEARDRDLGWRQIRVDVPVILSMRDGASAGLLIGLYVDTDAEGGAEGLSVAGSARTMAAEFQGGLEDGRRAAVGLLQQLGADQALLRPFRSLAVSALGLREPPAGQQEPLRGRSAGLPTALAVLRRAAEIDGFPLPAPEFATTGCIEPSGGLVKMSREAAEIKLAAVESDGWLRGLICPPLSDLGLEGEVETAADLDAAAELIWGGAWLRWKERLFKKSEPRKVLLEAIERYLERFNGAPLERSGPPEVRRRWRLDGSDASHSVSKARIRAGASAVGATAGRLSLDIDEEDLDLIELEERQAEDITSILSDAGEDGDAIPPGDAPATPRIYSWDPFGSDEYHAVVTGGSGDDHTELLRRHTDAWLQEARRPGTIEVPMLFEAVALADALKKSPSPSLSSAIASLLGIDVKRPEYTYLKEAVAEGGLVLSVDGWELVGDDKGQLGTALAELGSNGGRLIIAERGVDGGSAGCAFGDTHSHNELTGLSDSEVEELARSLLETRAGQFLSLRARNQQFAELTRTLPLMQHLVRAAKTLDRPERMTRAVLLKGALLSALENDDQALATVAAAIVETAGAQGTAYRIGVDDLRRAVTVEERRRADGDGDLRDDDVVSLLLRSHVLVEEELGGRSELRFEHSILQLTCIALHLTTLPVDVRWAKLRDGAWNDSRKESLIELCCGLADDPEEIIARLLSDEEDHWDQRLALAARCICEVGRRKFDLARAVISRLFEAIITARPLAERRYLGESLAALVEAPVEGAAETAARVLERPDLPHPVTARLAESMARVGDTRGLNFLTALAHDPGTIRSAIAFDALGELDNSNALLLLEELLISRLCDPGLLSRTNVLTRGGEPELRRLATLLREQRITIAVRQALGLGIASIPSAHGIALAAAVDRRVPWTVRAAVAVRLATRSPLPAPLRELALSPNLPWDWRARLATAMLIGGDTSALGEATMILQYPLSSTERAALVDALAKTQVGRQSLEQYVQDGSGAWSGFTVTLSALLRAGQPGAAEIAIGLVTDDEVNLRVAARLVRSLCDVEEEGWEILAKNLLDNPELDGRDRLTLGVRMEAAGVLDDDTFRSLLLGASGKAPLDLQAALVRARVAATSSWEPLEQMIEDPYSPMAVRVELAAVACAAARDSVSQPLPGCVCHLLTGPALSSAQRAILANAIAQLGKPEHTEVILRSLLDGELLRSRVLRSLVREMLTGPGRVELDQGLKEKLAVAMSQPERRTSIGNASASPALQTRIGERMALYMSAAGTELLEQYLAADEDVLTTELFEQEVPFFEEIVVEELTALERSASGKELEETAAGPDLRQGALREPMDITSFRSWASILAVNPSDRSRSQDFVGDLSQPGPELESWLEGDGPQWPFEAAHRFLLERLRRGGLVRAYEVAFNSNLLETMMRSCLEVGAGRELLDVAAMQAVISRRDVEPFGGENAPTYFYASLGAALWGRNELAVRLMGDCARSLGGEDEETRERMADQGLGTIDEVETLHGLDDRPCMQAMRRVLALATEPEPRAFLP